MKISITKDGETEFTVLIGETAVSVDADDLKALLIAATQVLMPGDEMSQKTESEAKVFIARMKEADDVSIQKFIITTDGEDILVLLKYAEEDEALQEKFYGNMSDRSRKIHQEDLAYEFKEGIPGGRLESSFSRLLRIAKQMEDEGSLTYSFD